MTELLTAAQMRAIEQAAIDSGEVTGLELMERAGRGVVEAVLEEWPEMAMTSGRAVVLCGPGNNGGDGFVVARLLKDRGWEVEVFLYGEVEKLPPDAKVNAERWLEVGEVEDIFKSPDAIERFPDLVVDSVFGTGLSRPLDVDIAQVLKCFSQQFVVSVDIQSGLDADSGRLLSSDLAFDEIETISPALTVSFHHSKVGHYLDQNPNSDKQLAVKDIGLPISRNVSQRQNLNAVKLLDRSSRGSLSKVTAPHKYSHGHALVLSGALGRTGACRLAARGALRIGAGVVTITSPKNAMAERAAQLNAIMLREVDSPADLSKMLEDTRINALCLGPALGLGNKTRKLVKVALKSGRATVLDADALSIFKDDPETLFGMLHENVVLTPHGGEFGRLFPDIAEKLAAPATKGPAYSKVDATCDAAKRAGCVVLYKGADTVIADPNGRASINSAHYDRAAPWLATAGSGDVLAGFITGLLARGFAPMQAAETAAWLHVECARSFGPGLIAEDLPEQLPKVFRDLGL